MSSLDIGKIAEAARGVVNGAGSFRWIGILAARRLVEAAAPLIEQHVRQEIAEQIERLAAYEWEPPHQSNRQEDFAAAARIARGEPSGRGES